MNTQDNTTNNSTIRIALSTGANKRIVMNTRTKILTLLITAIAYPAFASDEPSPRVAGLQNKEALYNQQNLKYWTNPQPSPTEDEVHKNQRETNEKIPAALPEKLSVPVAHKRRILVITCNTLQYCHMYGAAGMLTMIRAAEKKYDGAFEFTEVYTDEGIDAKMLSGFDAVILNNDAFTGVWVKNYEISPTKNDDLYNKLLPEYVRNGGGLFCNHSTTEMLVIPNGDLVKNCPNFSALKKEDPHGSMEFLKLLGAYALGHPGPKPEFKKWNYVLPFPIKVSDPKSPLTAALRNPPQKTFIKNPWYKAEVNAPAELVDELYIVYRPESFKETKDANWHCLVEIDPNSPADMNPNGKLNEASSALV